MILGIDPKVDYVFKKLFGSEANKPLLIALLNAILRAFLAEPIVDVEILNPFNDKDLLDDKLSILDIKARDRQRAIVQYRNGDGGREGVSEAHPFLLVEALPIAASRGR